MVIVRSGRNGDFTVGELSNEIGKFRIKNLVLASLCSQKHQFDDFVICFYLLCSQKISPLVK
ncbi:MAG: DUF3275 family protein [Neisseriaceae bacterium]|nr:DUF3275 family protein [Neisseriaceae bacterium]